LDHYYFFPPSFRERTKVLHSPTHCLQIETCTNLEAKAGLICLQALLAASTSRIRYLQSETCTPSEAKAGVIPLQASLAASTDPTSVRIRGEVESLIKQLRDTRVPPDPTLLGASASDPFADLSPAPDIDGSWQLV
jgi:hypothetical protein